MAASREWEDVHLTPGGWVDGSYKHDFQPVTEVPRPSNAVLTVTRRVHVAALLAKPDISETEVAHTSDTALIAELKAKYGKPTFGC